MGILLQLILEELGLEVVVEEVGLVFDELAHESSLHGLHRLVDFAMGLVLSLEVN